MMLCVKTQLKSLLAVCMTERKSKKKLSEYFLLLLKIHLTFQSPKDGEDKGGGSPLKKGAGSVKKDGAAGAEKNEDFEDGGGPLIYLCATCWHETEGEMLSLLKSLFR